MARTALTNTRTGATVGHIEEDGTVSNILGDIYEVAEIDRVWLRHRHNIDMRDISAVGYLLPFCQRRMNEEDAS